MINLPAGELPGPSSPVHSQDTTLFAELIAHLGLPTFDKQFVAVIGRVFDGVRVAVYEARHHDPVCILDSHSGEGRGLAAVTLMVRGAVGAHRRGGPSKAFQVHPSGHHAGAGADAHPVLDTPAADSLVFTCSAGKVIYAVCIARPGIGFSRPERDRFASMSTWLAASLVKDKENRVMEFRYGDGVVNRIVALSPRFTALSPREKSVCVGILTGHTTEAIALHLEISENSVLTFRRRLYQKLGINAQNELFASALIAAREMSRSASPPRMEYPN